MAPPSIGYCPRVPAPALDPPSVVAEVDLVARRDMDIDLRPLQREALDSVLAGRDTLLVSPTGWASCRLPAPAGALLVARPWSCALDRAAGGPARSLRRHGHRHRRRDQLPAGPASPRQRLGEGRLGRGAVRSARGRTAAHPQRPAALSEVLIDRFIVDEAHCIDSWGPDPRPDFTALGGTAPAR